MRAVADEQQRSAPALAPRTALRLTPSPITGPGRLAGEGTIDQVAGDLEQLRLLGADTVVLGPFNGDPHETYHPQAAWQMLATLAATSGRWAHARRRRSRIPGPSPEPGAAARPTLPVRATDPPTT
jgi:hypothetical protein